MRESGYAIILSYIILRFYVCSRRLIFTQAASVDRSIVITSFILKKKKKKKKKKKEKKRNGSTSYMCHIILFR